MTQHTSPIIQSTQNSLDIIREIKIRNGAKLSELTAALDMSRSTIHNHLKTLIQNGYVARSGSEYNLGMYLLHLGVQARLRSPSFQGLEEFVEELANETDLEVDFTVEENGRQITLFNEISGEKRSDIQVGSCFHLHNNASGKAILSEYPNDRVEEIIDRWGLPATTENTITEKEDLFAELEKIRERGYSINNQEQLEGFSSISMSVSFPEGDLYGAITIGGPTYRVEAEEEQIISYLEESSTEIESMLTEGYQGSDPNWWKEVWDCDRVNSEY